MKITKTKRCYADTKVQKVKKNREIKTAQEIYGEDTTIDTYLDSLEATLQDDLEGYQGINDILFNLENDAIDIDIALGDMMQEFQVPFSDLTLDENQIDKDVDYIEKDIKDWINSKSNN